MDDGVAREIALSVLREFGVFVATVEDGKYSLSKGNGEPEIHRLPAVLGRKAVGYIARKFAVPVHMFWHPEQVPGWKAARGQGDGSGDPN